LNAVGQHIAALRQLRVEKGTGTRRLEATNNLRKGQRLTAADRVLQKTPYTFDVSVWEFFWPLLVGAQLVVARPGAHRDPDELVRVIGEHGITTVHFVPSMLQAFLDAADLTPAGCLERVICSGEALAPALQDRFFGPEQSQSSDDELKEIATKWKKAA